MHKIDNFFLHNNIYKQKNSLTSENKLVNLIY